MTSPPLRPHPEQFGLTLPWTISVRHGEEVLCDFDAKLWFRCYWKLGHLWHVVDRIETINGPLYATSYPALYTLIRQCITRDHSKIHDYLTEIARAQGRTNP